MRYWWVNQNQTHRQEQRGNFMWSPKRKIDGHRNYFYDTMRIVAPGDIVLSFRQGEIGALGVAQSYCYESPKPQDFGNVGLNWDAIGWRVDVDWQPLRVSVRPADLIVALRPTLPHKYAPIRAQNGHGLQSVYLAEIPVAMVHVLASAIGHEALSLVEALPSPIQQSWAERPDHQVRLRIEWEDSIERRIVESANISEAQRTALVRARSGEGQYRRDVRKVEKACRVTRVENPEHLIASHCKPWRFADNSERLDGENGLMSTPTIAHLFERGFISFDDSGRLLISPVADRTSLERIGIDVGRPMQVGRFSEGQRRYLDFHRNDIFLEVRRG